MFDWISISVPSMSQVIKLGALIVPLAGMAFTNSASNPEEAGVRVALNAYLEGHATGQADAFRRAFSPEARMLYVRDGHLVKTEIADYIARAPGKAAADEDKRRRTIDLVDIVGAAAIAKVTLVYPDVTFTDYMTLLKIDGEWRIVSKVFHADRKDRKS